MSDFIKATTIIILMAITTNGWAKDLAASIAVNYNTGAYAYDAGLNLIHTEKDAIRKCEKKCNSPKQSK